MGTTPIRVRRLVWQMPAFGCSVIQRDAIGRIREKTYNMISLLAGTFYCWLLRKLGVNAHYASESSTLYLQQDQYLSAQMHLAPQVTPVI
jgi:hypothetical protein